MKVAVIGGGPSGLATLRFLSKAHEFFPIPPLEVRLFESRADIGGTFVYRVYEDAELVSSKFLTTFSDFRLPMDAPDFLTPERYVKYLKDYATHFGLLDLIETSTKVQRATRTADGVGHVLSISKADGSEESWTCDAIAVCCGLNGQPSIPDIDGIENVPTVFHSSELKKRSQFGVDTNVVILGAGETAMDAGHLAVTSPTKSVTLCHRAGFFVAPKIVPQPQVSYRKALERRHIPIDTTTASLFDTAYAHPLLQRGPLLWLAYDMFVKNMFFVISGTQEGPDQWVGQMDPDRKYMDSIFLIKSDRAIPYMSAGHRSEEPWNIKRATYINVPIRDNNGRTIEVAKWPTKVDENGFMQFNETDMTVKPDVVLYATGYKTDFSFLGDEYPRLNDADVRGVYSRNDVSVGFIGFVRPNFGAIPPLAELQSQLWVLRLLQHKYPQQLAHTMMRGADALDGYELDYRLHARAGYDLAVTKRAVDQESYAYQLALDIGGAPTITYVMKKGWKVFFTWAMGSNFNPKFRLVGPWKMESEAVETMKTELYDVVQDSGGAVYFTFYTLLPFIIFGFISITLYALQGVVEMPVNVGRRVLRPFAYIKQKLH